MTDSKLDKLIEKYGKLAIDDKASCFKGYLTATKNKAKQAIIDYVEEEKGNVF